VTRSTKLGLAALVLYLPHAAWHIAHGHPWDLMWACDLAMPILAFGCFARRGRAAVTAFLFLVYGSPMWLLDIVAGGGWVLTSPLIHIGGLVVAYLAVKTLGWSPRTWIVASASAAAILVLTRLISPSEENVNMVFRVYSGWEKYFSSHAVYIAGIWLSLTALFWMVEKVMLKRCAVSPSS
jgi:hypothetical protein